MNIQEACTKRINERRALELARQRADRLERQAKNVREEYAANLIHAWIARVYSLDLDLSTMAVNEENHQATGGIYQLTITLDGDTIETPRGFELRDGNPLQGGNAFPVPCKFDAPERGQFAEFWRALRNGYLVKYDDLIDAVIYVTDAEASTPAVTEQELDAKIAALRYHPGKMDVTGR